MNTNTSFKRLMLAASAGAFLTGTSAFASHEDSITMDTTRTAHPSAELRTETRTSIYDPAGAETHVYTSDSSRQGLSAGFNSEWNSNADLNAQADHILRAYGKGKMPAELADREFHQSNGETLFPRFQAYRPMNSNYRSARVSKSSIHSETMNEPAGASVELSGPSTLNSSSSTTISSGTSSSTGRGNDWQKGYFNSQSSRGVEIKDPAGADISVRATQSPSDLTPSVDAKAPSAEVKTSISSDLKDPVISDPSRVDIQNSSRVDIKTSKDLNNLNNSTGLNGSTNSQLGGVNNQNKDSSKFADPNASRVNESAGSLNKSPSVDVEVTPAPEADSSAQGGINNQSKDGTK